MSTPNGSTGTSKRGLGRLAQVVGIIGAIASIAIVLGLLVGRSWVEDRWGEVLATGDRGIAKVTAGAETIASALDERAAEVSAIAEKARGIAAEPAPVADALVGIIGELTGVSDRYANLKERYLDLREKAETAVDLVHTIDRLVPAFDVPQGPLDVLGRIDEGLTTVDGIVSAIGEAGAASGEVKATATTIAEKGDELAAGLTNAAATVRELGTGADSFAGEIAAAGTRVTSLLGVVMLALALVFVWSVVLHGALWSLGRRIGRG